jgi:RPA family protein
MNAIRKREVAKRLFGFELGRSTYRIHDEGEDEMSPFYVLTPLGSKVNRVFVVGVLLDKEEIKPDSGIWRIRISDPTGAIYSYVSRFQPDALESLMEIEPPEIVSIVGKIRTFEVESRILVSVRPEYLTPVDSDTRDYWVLETAKRTIERINAMESKEDDYCKLAWQIYNPNLDEYRQIVKQALLSLKEGYTVEGQEVTEEIKEIEEELEFEEEEWDLSDLLGE